MPNQLTIREVSPRDGLQAEPVLVSTPDKIALVDSLTRAGFTRINAVSFASPRVMPNLADGAEVLAGITRADGVVYDATVPNLVGARRAVDAGADALTVFVIAADIAGYGGQQRPVADQAAEAAQVVDLARGHGLGAVVTISTAFGAPDGTSVDPDLVVSLATRLAEQGATGIALADSTGRGTPSQVRDLVARLLPVLGDVELSLHLHDTRGLALANAFAGIEAGIGHLDAAVGGIGGTPGRGGHGNLATEDLLYLCNGEGIAHGIDATLVAAVRAQLRELLRHELPGRAGLADAAATHS